MDRISPAEFLWLTLRRIANVWIGPIHRPSGSGSFELTSWLSWIVGSFRAISIPSERVDHSPGSLPFTYYFFAYMPRYRQPIDWILVVLAAPRFGAGLYPILRRNGPSG